MSGPLAIIEVGSMVMAPVGFTTAMARVKSIDDGYCCVEFDDADQTLVDDSRNVFLFAELALVVVGTIFVCELMIPQNCKPL